MGTTTNGFHWCKVELILFCFEMCICSYFEKGTSQSTLHCNNLFTGLSPLQDYEFLQGLYLEQRLIPNRRHYKVTESLKQGPQCFNIEIFSKDKH